VVAKGEAYEIYREQHGDVVRLIGKYVDSGNRDIYSMHIVELDRNTLRIYTKWNISPEWRGERLDAVRLDESSAAELRRRMLSINSAWDFRQLTWDLGL
jgi:hypothetical protein